MNNLELWNKVEKTNPAHTKKVNFGRAITAIDPYHQIKNATEQFGPAGQGWGWEVRDVKEFTTNEVAVLVRVWVRSKAFNTDGYIEQWGQNGLYIDKAETKKDTDHMKKATTDGLTKCLSCMGFNADIFLGKFDDNKYVQQVTKEFQEPTEKELMTKYGSELKAKLKAAGIISAISELQSEYCSKLKNETYRKRVMELCNKRLAEIGENSDG